MTPTFLRAAQAKVEVLDMRAATQGLPPFNRYVHKSCRVVMDSVARWTEELSSAESVSAVLTHASSYNGGQGYNL